MKRFGLSLAYQIMILVIVLSFLPAILGNLYTNYRVQNDLNGVNQAQVMSSDQASHQLLLQMANSFAGVANSDGEWTQGMQAIQKKNIAFIKSNILNAVGSGGVTFAIVADANGNVLGESGDQPNLASSSVFASLIKAMQGKSSTTMMSGVINTPTGFAVLTITPSTNNAGTAPAAGYLAFGATVSTKTLQTVKQVTGSDLALQAQSGQLVSSTSAIQSSTLAPFASVLNGKQSSQFSTSTTNGMLNASYATPLTNLLGQPIGLLYTLKPLVASSKINSDLASMNDILFVIHIALLIVLLLILASRLQPLRRVSKILLTVSEGSLKETVPTRFLRRTDEVGVIATATSQMIEQLRNTISSMVTEIMGVSDNVATSSKDLAITSEQNLETVTSISQSAEVMAERAQDQADKIGVIAITMQEMEKALHQMVQSSEKASEMADDASTSAKYGVTTIEQLETKIADIAKDSNILSDGIDQLGKRSQEIRKIVDAITEIAEQTHLLSLNAAIEAARAGDSGKGFAVVAVEVQKLADQSATSAGKIQELVTAIQQDVAKVVVTATSTDRSVKEGLTAVSGARTAFTDIGQSVQHVADQLMSMLSAIEEISSSSDDVAKTMDAVSDISKGNAFESRLVSNMTQKQLTSTQGLRDAADALTEMANQLEIAIKRFEV